MALKTLLKRDRLEAAERSYEIRTNEVEGRHMVASRDIKAGELIVQELPCSLGPGHFTAPVCLGCYKFVDGSALCSRCGWPLCSEVK